MVYRFKGIDRDVSQILKDFHFGPKAELTLSEENITKLKTETEILDKKKIKN